MEGSNVVLAREALVNGKPLALGGFELAVALIHKR